MAEKPSRRLYIGNLSRRTSERDIRYEFEKFGRIVDLVIKDYRFPFGFCEFESRADATEAKNHWHDQLFDDKRLIVSFAQKGERTCSSGRSNEYKKARVYKGKWRISVENLSHQVSWQDLKDAARQFGRSVCFAKTWTNRGENLGVVEFADKQDFEDALDNMQGMRLGGRRLVVYQEGSEPPARKRSRTRSYRRSRSASWAKSRQRGRYPKKRNRDSSRTRNRDDYYSRETRRNASVSRDSRDNKRRRLARENSKEWSNSRSRSPPAKKRRAESPIKEVKAESIGERKEMRSSDERKKSIERERKPRESKSKRRKTKSRGSKKRKEREHSTSRAAASSSESRDRGRALPHVQDERG